MATNNELIVLQNLLKAVESDTPSIYSRIWFTLIFWLISAVIFIAAFKYHENNDSIFALVFCSLIIGIAIGHTSHMKANKKTWLIIKKYIDKKLIKSRINEINT